MYFGLVQIFWRLLNLWCEICENVVGAKSGMANVNSSVYYLYYVELIVSKMKYLNKVGFETIEDSKSIDNFEDFFTNSQSIQK